MRPRPHIWFWCSPLAEATWFGAQFPVRAAENFKSKSCFWSQLAIVILSQLILTLLYQSCGWGTTQGQSFPALARRKCHACSFVYRYRTASTDHDGAFSDVRQCCGIRQLSFTIHSRPHARQKSRVISVISASLATRCFLVCLCFSGQRGTVALKLGVMYERSICVMCAVAVTGSARGAQTHPPTCLLLPRAILYCSSTFR